MKALLFVILACTFLQCQAQSYTPGPTISAAPYPPPAASQPASARLYVDSAQQPQGTCRVRKLSDGSACPECDLSSIARLGTMTLQMEVVDAGGVPSKRSEPLVVVMSKTACGKLAADGTVRCNLQLSQPTPLPALNACSAPPDPVYVVTGAQAFPLRADGTRSTTPWQTAPVRGEPCDCSGSNRLLSFGALFCKVPSLSAAQTIVAGCSVKQ